MRGAGDADGDTFDNLENTLREINEIGTILKASNISDIACLTGTEASEKAFRSLDNSHVNILHIATHGTYKEERRSSDAESMASSLLAFAGANMGGATDDDGLVTAADVAAMNLRQCDLAVLSACETGLGKLGDDGVFGLQRGFKNAGVHTLLMSLKNVYDESTADMMIGFYRYLTKGISKREALVRAQRDIREAGFKDSKYWATFILLDAF
jgi:CHAT domain-containing protein